MKTFVTNDGDLFRVKGREDLLQAMRNAAFFETPSDEAFMEDVGKRIFKTTGEQINITDPVKFIDDLLRLKFVREGVHKQ